MREKVRQKLCLAVVATLSGAGALHAADRTFNVSLVSSFNPVGGTTNNYYSDVWADGNLAVLGSVGSTGVWILNISNLAAPSLHSYYNPPGTQTGQFRDILVRNNIGYFALDDSTSAGGIDIVDLSNPASPVFLTEINAGQNGFARNHDLFIDGNYLYIASNQVTTIKVFNISNPAAPTFVRNIVTTGTSTQDLHDMTIKNGRMYTSNITSGLTEIYDVSDVGSGSWSEASRRLGSFNTGTRNHSAWPSEDGNLVAVAREDATGDVQLWNTSNPASPSLVSTITKSAYNIDSFSPHNPVIIGDTLYVSWYQGGLQIFNIRNPATPVHLGAYDTFVGGSGNSGSFLGYDGNWGLYPWFGKDKILLSDFDGGLFVVNANAAFQQVWTYATDATGKWQANARWDNGDGPFPDSSEMTASFTNPAANRTVTIDGSLPPLRPRVAGFEILGSLDYTIQATNGGELEMKSSSGPATITVLPPAGAAQASTVSVPLILTSDLMVTNNAGATVTPTLSLASMRGSGRTVTFAGNGNTALTGANPTFTGNIAVNSGTLTLRHGGATNGQPVSLAGGKLALENNASTNFQSSVTVTNSAALSVGNAGSGTGQTHSISSLNIHAGKTLTFSRANGAHLSANVALVSGTLQLTPGSGAGAAARINTLTLPAGGKFDLADGLLVVANGGVGSWNGSSYTSTTGHIANGRNSGLWNSPGLTTSMSNATNGSGYTSLGIASASEVKGIAAGATDTWAGITVTGSNTLVMYTYGGDANLSGNVDIDDYGQIDFNASTGGGLTGWFNGDFDYNGTQDIDDYGIIDFVVNIQGPPFSTGAGEQLLSSVPEPASLAMLALAPLALLRRRRN